METPTIQTPPKPLHKPKGCYSLSEIGDSQIRLGIQGPPFSGKTTASLTFPNPIILSFDRKVSAHKHRQDVICVPFHDVGFVSGYASWTQHESVNRKDALVKWLETEGIKLSPEQTLIIDGITTIEESFHAWYDDHEPELGGITKTGEKNSLVRYSEAKKYFEQLHLCVKSIPCNAIWICHETAQYTKTGEPTGKVRPLLAGQSGDKLGGNLTDFFRAWGIQKPKDDDMLKRMCSKFFLSAEQGKEWMSSTPANHDTIYMWQTCTDDVCDCGTSSLKDVPKFILPNYETFQKYRR